MKNTVFNRIVSLSLLTTFVIGLFSFALISGFVNRTSYKKYNEIAFASAAQDAENIENLENDDHPQPASLPDHIVFPRRYSGENRASYHEQIRFSRNFFSNLNANFSSNVYGDCGYIGMAMLLTYYALTVSPRFVSQNYLEGIPSVLLSADDSYYESPGFKDFYPQVSIPDEDWEDVLGWKTEIERTKQIIARLESEVSNNENASREEYLLGIQRSRLEYYKRMLLEAEQRAYNPYVEAMIDLSETSLIGKLYEIASEIRKPDNQEQYIIDPVRSPSLGLNCEMVQAILNRYFEIAGLSNYVEVNTYKMEDFGDADDYGPHWNTKYEIESYVVSGKPILFQGRLFDSNASNQEGTPHICVAYDYNQEAGDLYGHTGWKNYSGTSRSNLDYEFRYFDGFLTIEISPNFRHEHNRQFVVDGSLKCSCELGSHDHWFTDWFYYNDQNYHARQCSCGELEYQRHEYYYLDTLTKRCSVCGKMVSTPITTN